MAKGKKTGGRNFEKGHRHSVGKGRPRIPDHLKIIQPITNSEIERLLAWMFTLPREEIMAILHKDNKSAPSLHILLASMIAKTASTADAARFNALLDRAAGKPEQKQTVEHRDFRLAYSLDDKKEEPENEA